MFDTLRIVIYHLGCIEYSLIIVSDFLPYCLWIRYFLVFTFSVIEQYLMHVLDIAGQIQYCIDKKLKHCGVVIEKFVKN